MRSTYVYPSGSPSTAKYIIVGEQPGRIEVIQGKPFIGPAGHELDSNLHLAGISRADCYFTNVIKDVDRPIGHYIDFTRKGPVVSEDGQRYINELAKELDSCTSQVIVALGNVALFALTDRTGITKWRGSILDATLLGNKRVVPSLHPSTIIPLRTSTLISASWFTISGEPNAWWKKATILKNGTSSSGPPTLSVSNS